MITTKEKRDEYIKSGSEIEKELYQIFDKDSDIVIADIGACDGLSSIIYSKMFPNAFIHAFEPIVENASEMTSNFIEYGIMDRSAIHLHALGDRNGIIKFYKSHGQAEGVKDWDTGNKSSSLLRPRKHIAEHKWCKFDTIEVNCRRLDDENIDYLDFAHIDVQGAELLVFKGGSKTFKNTKVIWIEVSNIDLYAQQPLKCQIEQFMKHNKFQCMKDTCGSGKYGDMLWVKK